MTTFNNRLTTPEDRSMPFDPFGKWEAEWSIHERDLQNYETYKQAVASDSQLAAKFKQIHNLFLKQYRSNFNSSEATQYAASTFGGYLRLFRRITALSTQHWMPLSNYSCTRGFPKGRLRAWTSREGVNQQEIEKHQRQGWILATENNQALADDCLTDRRDNCL